MGIQTVGRERKPISCSKYGWQLGCIRGEGQGKVRGQSRVSHTVKDTCVQTPSHADTYTGGHKVNNATQKLTQSTQRHVQETHLHRLMNTLSQTCPSRLWHHTHADRHSPSCRPTNTNAFPIHPSQPFSPIKLLGHLRPGLFIHL